MKDEELLIEKLKQSIIDETDLSQELSDEQMLSLIDRTICADEQISKLGAVRLAKIRKGLFDSFRRLDILQELLDDPGISEVMVNGSKSIYYEKNGRIEKWNKSFSSVEKLEDIIQQIVSGVNRSVNTASPIADARLSDGARVNVVLPPAAPDGPVITIRRFPAKPIDMEALLEKKSITHEAAEFLKKLVRAGYNIFISGGTGSGKTTFLNALSQFIPEGQRVVTIEDSAELQLTVENLVRLEARDANSDGQGEITIRDLIKTALRMRPDRLIVGEVRGVEALDMLQAMNTGHDGSLSTGHANSPKDMLTRLETLVLMGGDLPLSAIRGQIASALDIIVHLGRMRDGSRKVLSIVEVKEYADDKIELETLFEYREKEGLIKTGELSAKRKLESAGLCEV